MINIVSNSCLFQQFVSDDVSLLGSGEQLVYDSNPSLTYKPLFFKPKSTVGTTPIEVEKVYFIPSWWLNVKRINGKAQCIHVGKNSQLFMGDCDREEFEAILLLFDEITTKKIFNMAKPNEGLVKMGPNGEAQMLNGQETKFVLTEVQ